MSFSKRRGLVSFPHARFQSSIWPPFVWRQWKFPAVVYLVELEVAHRPTKSITSAFIIWRLINLASYVQFMNLFWSNYTDVFETLGTDLRGTKNKSWTFSWSKCFVEQSTWSGLDIWTHHANNDNVQKSLIFLNFQVRQVWMQKWMGKLHCEPLSTFWWLHWFPHSLDWSWFWWCILATPKPNPFWEVEIRRNAKWISWIISWI